MPATPTTRGTIVALHGVTDNAASLHHLARHYAPNWEVVLFDLLGHGHARRFTKTELQDPFQALINHAEQHLLKQAKHKSPLVLLGHSLGGAIAAHLAARHPDLIKTLVLEDPALLTPEQHRRYATTKKAYAHATSLAPDFQAAIAWVEEKYPTWPKEELYGWACGKREVDEEFLKTGVVGCIGFEVLRQVQVPTLLITGDGPDVLFDSARLEEVAALGNPWITTAKISGATHTVRRDKVGDFYIAVDGFLDESAPL